MNRKIVVLHDEQDKAMAMLPKQFQPILALSEESFLEKAEQYEPTVCIMKPSLFSRSPWGLMELLDARCSDIKHLFIRAETEEEYQVYQYLRREFPTLIPLDPLLTEQEVLLIVQHFLTSSVVHNTLPLFPPKVRAFLGSGGTGITSFLILAAPWYVERHPEKKLLLVDMNADKRDLTVALGAQAAQLAHMSAYLVRGQDQFTPFSLRHPTYENISVISAVKAWGSQEIVTFLTVAKREYDEIWIDVGRPDHVPRLLEEADDLIYVVRPDELCLGATKRVLRPQHATKERLLITQLDDRYASKDEISGYLGVKNIMGVMPYEHPFLPLKLERGSLPLDKKRRKALEKLQWAFAGEEKTSNGNVLHAFMGRWKR